MFHKGVKMSKEQKFHKLIQQQDAEGKEDLWNKIEQQTGNNEQVNLHGGVLAKKRVLSKQNIILICAASLLVIVGIILTCTFIKPNKNDGFRYCEFGDYYSVEVDQSICDYAENNNLNLLYFDWYEEALYYADKQYKLNSTNEVICLFEELIDENEIYISEYVTSANTKIDFLEAFKSYCVETTNIKSVNIKYGMSSMDTYAHFNKGDHEYLIRLENYTDIEYILKLINDILI